MLRILERTFPGPSHASVMLFASKVALHLQLWQPYFMVLIQGLHFLLEKDCCLAGGCAVSTLVLSANLCRRSIISRCVSLLVALFCTATCIVIIVSLCSLMISLQKINKAGSFPAITSFSAPTNFRAELSLWSLCSALLPALVCHLSRASRNEGSPLWWCCYAHDCC